MEFEQNNRLIWYLIGHGEFEQVRTSLDESSLDLREWKAYKEITSNNQWSN